ncbi:3-epi-6-deoxocathasterone 23-monooxygenase-like isoform X1 [Hibiscus syriacus]|uniref:3-epi-6-deoxocathasterone 23-monooxygenase-like isoform X1 n=1 Tax=Hibiscus syriacus TaxID=106335 RepID=A0A6A2XQ22_HIBSY|nr:3-epi-6-deoxocathasterone 23-monooxygenase-like isoform X1 [Hibiscus syriacus]
MKQLKALLDLVNENEDSIFKALAQDLGKSPVESYRDEGDLPLLLFPSKAEVIPEPLGVVLIFSSWNFPIKVALDPLIGAISTGNTVMLKPSELAPACMSFLIQAIPQYLDNKAIKVIGGGADVGERLIELRWDKIFFTVGSPRVGRLIMTAAGKHLTPVTLELGGKCLAIVHNTLSNPSKAKVTAKRIIRGKWGPCTGQACIAIDYVLVEEKLASTLIVILMKCIKRFYGDNLKELNSISRIVNKHQFQRLVDLMKDPHVASFGPLLPIITVRDSQP